MDCFGTYFTHAQTCENVRGQSATQWTASVHICPNLWWRSCSKCYAMDCFGTYFTHAQTWDYVRVQSATQRTTSVHALHMPKPVITFVFKVLRNGLLRYMLYTCPNLWSLTRVHTWTALIIFEILTSLNTFAYFGINFETYMQWHRSLACAHMVDPTQYSLDWTCQHDLAFTYAINMFVHVQTWSMLRHFQLIENFKHKNARTPSIYLPTCRHDRCYAMFTWLNNENCCSTMKTVNVKTRKKVIKNCDFTDARNVHFLMQITYESPDHWKCDVALAWEKPFQKTNAFLQFCQFFYKQMENNKDSTGMIHDKMMVFTIHLLRAQERLKHCW